MEKEAIERAMETIVREDGAWSAHSIHLGHGLYTIPVEEHDGRPVALHRVVQMAADLLGKPLAEARVLDLGCLEGLYGLEFALQGARVVGVEGREISLRKARLAQQALGLTNIEFVREDVRRLSKERFGSFDVVLCIGLLYHLDVPDVFRLVETMAGMCTRLTIVHTHVSVAPRRRREWRGATYCGCEFVEHLSSEDAEVRERAVWGSIGNEKSFWLTRASLFNLLGAAGFTTVHECRNPYLFNQPGDHVTLAAIKGDPVRFRAHPRMNGASPAPWPERRRMTVNPGQKAFYPLVRRVSGWVPRRLLRGLRESPWVREMFGLEWHSRRR